MQHAPLARIENAFTQILDLGGAGCRVGIKDSIDIQGYPTRAGSAALSNSPPAACHAKVVADLLDAGCHIVGKTNMHELAYGVTGVNRWAGTPLNPRYPDRIPGGSSSGSAVSVAAALVDFAIGTDTGGSIRLPAACCGVVGFKPSFGRVSRAGVHPAFSTLDCVGPLARNVEMIETAMMLMDRTFHTAPLPASMKVGIVSVAAEPRIRRFVRAEFEKAGIPLVEIRLPSLVEAFNAGLAIIAAETWAAFGHLVGSPGLGDDVRARLIAAGRVDETATLAAESSRTRFRAEVDSALQTVDALALPTLPDYPLKLTESDDCSAALSISSLVRPFNLSGHPAITLPLRSDELAPVGLQLVGPIGMDSGLCAVARGLSLQLSH